MGTQQCPIAAKQPSCSKANLTETRNNDTIIRKVGVDRNNFALGKNAGYMPSSLGSRLISVGRQLVSE